jgi:hypothetical protein
MRVPKMGRISMKTRNSISLPPAKNKTRNIKKTLKDIRRKNGLYCQPLKTRKRMAPKKRRVTRNVIGY